MTKIYDYGIFIAVINIARGAVWLRVAKARPLQLDTVNSDERKQELIPLCDKCRRIFLCFI